MRLPASTNSFGGQDRDLLQRASGAQVFMEVATTCAKCGFSGWPADFWQKKRRRRNSEDIELDEQVSQAILEGALKKPAALQDVPHEPGKPFAHLPAWARLDLAAQTVRLRGGDEERVADLLLQASWAVRLGYHPVHFPGPETQQHKEWLQSLLERLAEQAHAQGLVNPAQAEIRIGAHLLSSAPRLAENLGCLAAGHGATVMRSHGEHEALLQAMVLLEFCVDKGEWPAKEQAIRDSVALERDYQRQAAEGFAKALADGTVAEDRAAISTYALGELERRLGERQKAIAHFDQALTMGGPEGLETWIREQRCLAENENPVHALLACGAGEGLGAP